MYMSIELTNRKLISALAMTLLYSHAYADQPTSPMAPSVQENLLAMDTNKDGMVTVSEVRAFIESKHGKGYQKDLMDKMEASTNGLSCATPFANRFF